MPLSRMNQIVSRIQRAGSSNAPSSLAQIQRGGPSTASSSLPISTSSADSQNSLHSLNNCDQPLSTDILSSPPAYINASPDLPVPTMSSLPTNLHPMVTRSKNGIFKPKVLNAAVDTSCYLADSNPTTTKVALQDPK
ncbi:hypothetical protein LWI29_011485 [Acer saccharum]|uniref:Uncharacterized protein n=1 Tax=Acer saccharum TaxID=4024 RepID=A0AA39W1C8_ACESA|nr:hypothetical protein LWI29_011485 [Acer saccharum]